MNEHRLALEAWEALFRAQHEVYSFISEDFSDDTLSQGEYDVMLSVSRAPEHALRLREVVAQMLISQPSVSRLVDRMVSRGLVIKKADPDDGRGAIITATDFGLRIFRVVATRHARSITTRMSMLTQEEQATLIALTEKLRLPEASALGAGVSAAVA